MPPLLAGLLRLTEITPFGPIINAPPRKGDLLFDDINMAVDLISRMVTRPRTRPLSVPTLALSLSGPHL